MDIKDKSNLRNISMIAEWLFSMGCDEVVEENAKVLNFTNGYQKNIVKTSKDDFSLLNKNIENNFSNLLELRNFIETKYSEANYKNHKGFLFSEGSTEADLMVVADNCENLDINKQKSFQKENGVLLLAMLKAINCDLNNTFFSSIAFCSSIDGHEPLKEDIMYNLEYFKKVIEFVSPKAIIMFGTLATQCLAETTDGIFSTRGKKYMIKLNGSTKCIPAISMYHPGYLLARPDKKKEAWVDLLEIQKIIELSH